MSQHLAATLLAGAWPILAALQLLKRLAQDAPSEIMESCLAYTEGLQLPTNTLQCLFTFLPCCQLHDQYLVR
jgi:hypothetical protein